MATQIAACFVILINYVFTLLKHFFFLYARIAFSRNILFLHTTQIKTVRQQCSLF